MNVSSEPLAGWTEVPERLVRGPLWMQGPPRRVWVRPYVGRHDTVVLVVVTHPSGLSYENEPDPADDPFPDPNQTTWFFETSRGEKHCGQAWGFAHVACMSAAVRAAFLALGHERAP